MDDWSRAEVCFTLTAFVIFLIAFIWLLCGIIRELTGPVLPDRDEHARDKFI